MSTFRLNRAIPWVQYSNNEFIVTGIEDKTDEQVKEEIKRGVAFQDYAEALSGVEPQQKLQKLAEVLTKIADEQELSIKDLISKYRS